MFLFTGWHILSVIKGDGAACCDCQVLCYRTTVWTLCLLCHSADKAPFSACVCVLANCISANFISIQSGFGLSQVLRHSVEGRKKHMSKYIHIEPDCSQTSWLQFDKWLLIGHTAAPAYWWVFRRRENDRGRQILRWRDKQANVWTAKPPNEKLFIFSNRFLP